MKLVTVEKPGGETMVAIYVDTTNGASCGEFRPDWTRVAYVPLKSLAKAILRLGEGDSKQEWL